MRRASIGGIIALGALALGVIAGGLILRNGGPRESLRAADDARALAALPRQPIAPMLALTEGSADLVIFMDGDAGWFELDLNALPPSTEIGMHGPRFLDAFTGNTHLPFYCSGSTTQPGKIIWIIQHAEIARDFAFCNRRRMDLGPLRPFGDPVTMVNADLSQADVEALRQRIAEDPTISAVSLPLTFRRFTHQRVIEAPYHWITFGGDRPNARLDEVLTQAITAQLGPFVDEAEIVTEQRGVSFFTDTVGLEDRAPTQAMGAGVAIDGDTVILPNVAITRFHMTVTCTPAACAALDGFDAAPLLDPVRRLQDLEAALATALPLNRQADDQMPTPEDLRNPATRLGATTLVTYPLRYIERPQSD